MFQGDNMFLYYLAVTLSLVIIAVLIVQIYFHLTIGWNKSNVCLVGKTALITGGNSGLGYQTALILAGRGARIIIADKNDSTESRNKIIEETKNVNIIGKFIDLTDLSSVRQFAKEINSEEERLDILINNAGVSGLFPGFTKDGLQLQMQINHFGPFLLTHLLVGLLKKSAPSRIIFISSVLGFLNYLTVDNLNKDASVKISFLNRHVQYCKSKLCNAICSIGFAERLKGTGVTCNAVHPGLARTPLLRIAMDVPGLHFWNELWDLVAKLFARSPHQGAQTQAYLAMADEIKNMSGKYFHDCRVWYQPWKTMDKQFCGAIWKKSEELVKLQPHEKL